MLCSLCPTLDPGDLQAIKALEKELATPLLAFRCYDLNASEVTPPQLARIQELEKRLGVSLVAVKS